jgi:chromosome segregation ATPase
MQDDHPDGTAKFAVAQSIQRIVRHFGDIRDLDQLGQMAMHVSDLEADATAAEARLAAVGTAEAQLKAAQAKADAIVAEARQQAAKIVQDAQAEADLHKTRSREAADSHVARARKSHDAWQAKAEQAEHQTKGIIAACEDKRGELQKLDNEIESKKAAHAAWLSRIAG